MANLTENRRAYDRARYLRRRGRHTLVNNRVERDMVELEKWSPPPGWIWTLLAAFWGTDVDQLQLVLRGAGAQRKEGGGAHLVTWQ